MDESTLPTETPPPELVSALAGRYSLGRRLASGGMGTVYLARDEKHSRDVAVKVLRPEIGRAVGRARFEREIAIAASLSHPHILPLIDSGAAGEHLYYVAPFVDGGTLEDRLRSEPRLPLEEAVRVVTEVASALQCAHDRNIIHRDIKPANILFQNGHAIVADFGIALALSDTEEFRLTTGGISLGTPLYMSAEQGLEGEVGFAADQYSLACVCYEMLTGQVPFEGRTAQAVIARHAVDPVPSLRTVRAGVPSAVEETLLRALAKAPEDRFPSVQAFADALRGASTGAVAVGSLRHLGKPRRRWGRYAAAAAAAAAIMAGAAGYFLFGSAAGEPASVPVATAGPPRLVVLPFANLGDPDDDFFAEGISDEIQSRIAGLSGLRVISRATASTLDPTTTTGAEIARALDVQYVLSGTIRTDRAADGSGSMQVIPHLARASDDVELYSDRINVQIEPGRLFEAQSIIAEAVAGALNVSLLLPERLTLQDRPTDNLEAYEAFLRGNVYATHRFLPEPSRQATEMYERAVQLDTSFAIAFARLAQANAIRSFYFENRRAEAHAALDRAEALDPDLVETRLAEGYVSYFVDYDLSGTLEVLEPLARVRPNNAELLWLIGSAKSRRGDWQGAVEDLLRAADLDPRSQTFALSAGSVLYSLRRFEESDAYYARALEIAPDYLAARTSRAWLQVVWKGDVEAAMTMLHQALEYTDVATVMAYLVGFRGFLPMLDEPFQDGLEQLSLATHRMDSASYYLAKAELRERRRDPEGAIAYFDSARVVLEGAPGPSPWMPVALAGLGRFQEALAAADVAETQPGVRDDPVYGPTLRFWLAQARLRAGDVEGANTLLDGLLDGPGFVTPQLLRVHPAFDPHREDPWFAGLMEGRASGP